jgi:ectoine hydroxylase-related dioxygenase (phytanoyl-CoA dioxygenase family)
MTLIQARLLNEEQLRQFDEQGYLVLRNLLSPEEVADIRETFMAEADKGPVPGLFEASNSFSPDDPLARYPRMMHPHRHPDKPVGPLSLRYLLDRRFEAALTGLFGEEAVAAQTMFYFKPPGARGQAPHQDNFYLRVHPGTCMAAWVAIDDADEENGGLVVVPGSHRYEVFCPDTADLERSFTSHFVKTPEGLSEVQLRLKAGDVLFFNGSLIHGSNPNASRDRFRCAFICHYVPKSSAETSRFYRPLLQFNGKEAFVEDATGGGPCGTVPEAAAAH